MRRGGVRRVVWGGRRPTTPLLPASAASPSLVGADLRKISVGGQDRDQVICCVSRREEASSSRRVEPWRVAACRRPSPRFHNRRPRRPRPRSPPPPHFGFVACPPPRCASPPSPPTHVRSPPRAAPRPSLAVVDRRAALCGAVAGARRRRRRHDGRATATAALPPSTITTPPLPSPPFCTSRGGLSMG